MKHLAYGLALILTLNALPTLTMQEKKQKETIYTILDGYLEEEPITINTANELNKRKKEYASIWLQEKYDIKEKDLDKIIGNEFIDPFTQNSLEELSTSIVMLEEETKMVPMIMKKGTKLSNLKASHSIKETLDFLTFASAYKDEEIFQLSDELDLLNQKLETEIPVHTTWNGTYGYPKKFSTINESENYPEQITLKHGCPYPIYSNIDSIKFDLTYTKKNWKPSTIGLFTGATYLFGGPLALIPFAYTLYSNIKNSYNTTTLFTELESAENNLKKLNISLKKLKLAKKLYQEAYQNNQMQTEIVTTDEEDSFFDTNSEDEGPVEEFTNSRFDLLNQKLDSE